MDDERMKKLLVYCENLPADERAALASAMTASLSEDPGSEPVVDYAELDGRLVQFDGTPQRRTIEFTFKRKSPVVVQLNFSKDDLLPVVAYCEQVYSEPDGGFSLRFPIEAPPRTT